MSMESAVVVVKVIFFVMMLFSGWRMALTKNESDRRHWHTMIMLLMIMLLLLYVVDGLWQIIALLEGMS